MCLKILIYELRYQDAYSANEAASSRLSRSHPLNSLQLLKDLHTGWPEDGAAPPISALITLAQIGRLCPLHDGANLELPMNISKP